MKIWLKNILKIEWLVKCIQFPISHEVISIKLGSYRELNSNTGN